ncbi:hypothetical protein [Alkalihalobacillus pseudalcaliphilus]|uniref:hypothetical protein n=1 Tax=Alkalihalobacillus pseudalcaliphilus TaxID=79884 RepID=UPI00064DF8A3|nr:hypothetical protein [Alkalihalobacillus pseudalcaliphilus]KMK75241.1 hypothetical protein AB990_17585 [Alkalihalobacillus pseudalcaliphilus]
MQQVVDEQQLPYVYAAQDAGALLAFSIAVIVFNTLADMIQIEFVMVLASIFSFVAWIITYKFRKELIYLSN